MSSGHNTKGGSNGHFNHAHPNKVNVYSLLVSSLHPTMLCGALIEYDLLDHVSAFIRP